MGLRNPLPGYVSWITRPIGYSIGVGLIFMAWYVAGRMLLVTHYAECLGTPVRLLNPTAMQNAKALVGCVEARSGIVEWLAFRQTKRLFAALPSAPCDYVGTWQASRDESLYRISLSAAGQFVAEPVRSADSSARNITGSWGVVGPADRPYMVWLYDEGQVWPPDINTVTDERSDGFSLIEQNGSRTQFKRSGASACPTK